MLFVYNLKQIIRPKIVIENDQKNVVNLDLYNFFMIFWETLVLKWFKS